MKIAPKVELSLEESMEYIKEDEYLEVTPLNLRMKNMKFTEIELNKNLQKALLEINFKETTHSI